MVCTACGRSLRLTLSFGSYTLSWLSVRAAFVVNNTGPLLSQDWNELVKCGKNRVLITLSSLQLDWKVEREGKKNPADVSLQLLLLKMPGCFKE